MAVQCMICGHADDHEIVSHLNNEHKGGLGVYTLFFPGIPVTGPGVHQAILDWSHGRPMKPAEGFDRISDDDRRCIVDAAERSGFPRSEIVEVPDF